MGVRTVATVEAQTDLVCTERTIHQCCFVKKPLLSGPVREEPQQTSVHAIHSHIHSLKDEPDQILELCFAFYVSNYSIRSVAQKPQLQPYLSLWISSGQFTAVTECISIKYFTGYWYESVLRTCTVCVTQSTLIHLCAPSCNHKRGTRFLAVFFVTQRPELMGPVRRWAEESSRCMPKCAQISVKKGVTWPVGERFVKKKSGVGEKVLKFNVRWDEFARWSLLVGHGVKRKQVGGMKKKKRTQSSKSDRKIIIFVWININININSFIQAQRNTHIPLHNPAKKLVQLPNFTWILMKHFTSYSSPNWGALCCHWLSAVSLLTRHHEQPCGRKKKKKHVQDLCRYQHASGELVSWLLVETCTEQVPSQGQNQTLGRCLVQTSSVNRRSQLDTSSRE